MSLTTAQVANKLFEYCKNDQHTKAYEELYSPDIVSIEPDGTPMNRVEWMDALKVKIENWEKGFEQMEMQDSYIDEPVVCGNHICMPMWFTATTPNGEMKMDELCVYEVKDGKIVREQFFYDTSGMWGGEEKEC